MYKQNRNGKDQLSLLCRLNESNVHITFQLDQASIDELGEELIFGRSDLIANIGGYLGLCLGASVLSLYEYGVILCQRVFRSSGTKSGNSEA